MISWTNLLTRAIVPAACFLLFLVPGKSENEYSRNWTGQKPKSTIRHIVYKNSFSSSKLEKPIRIWLGETDKQDLLEGWISTENMKEV